LTARPSAAPRRTPPRPQFIVQGGEKHEATGHSFVAEANMPPRSIAMRRATDPWESHESGIMNTLVPEPEISSHQGPDAQSVDPDLDVVTMAVKVPETLAHLHYWSVQMTRRATKDEGVGAFRTSSRIALISTSDGLVALNAVKELKIAGARTYIVDNQAIVIPETIDAIRALTGTVKDSRESVARTDAAVGISHRLF
jgi:glyceraldehyde-3-phosphate dehydrogenase (NAD(P))